MLTLQEIIEQWVADNYGTSELREPSWNIEALVEHIKQEKPRDL